MIKVDEENGQREAMEAEVMAKAKRRQHSAEYKLRILREVDECKEKGEVGSLLRREGLYSSLVSKWREQRGERGSLNGLARQRRPDRTSSKEAMAASIAHLRRGQKAIHFSIDISP